MVRRETRLKVVDGAGRIGAGLGMLVGVAAAYGYHPSEPVSCRAESAAEKASECFGDAMLSGLMPYVLGLAAGLFLGGAMGLLVGRFLVTCVRSAGASSPSAPSAPPDGRWLIAKYESACSACRTPIDPGSPILHHGRGQTVCQTCGAG